MIVFVLWLVTSGYAVDMGHYPTAPLCGSVAVAMDAALAKPPRALLGVTMCVPTMLFVPHQAEPERKRPSAGA